MIFILNEPYKEKKLGLLKCFCPACPGASCGIVYDAIYIKTTNNLGTNNILFIYFHVVVVTQVIFYY